MLPLQIEYIWVSLLEEQWYNAQVNGSLIEGKMVCWEGYLFHGMTMPFGRTIVLTTGNLESILQHICGLVRSLVSFCDVPSDIASPPSPLHTTSFNNYGTTTKFVFFSRGRRLISPGIRSVQPLAYG